jgi:hypothetical protein
VKSAKGRTHVRWGKDAPLVAGLGFVVHAAFRFTVVVLATRGNKREEKMRTTILALLAVTAFGISLSTSTSAAPVNGAGAIASVVDSLSVVDTVHCTKKMHRHKNNKPHAYGTGCK